MKNINLSKFKIPSIPAHLAEFIDKYKFTLDTKPINIEDFNKNKFILVRHALSMYNFKSKVTKEDKGMEAYRNEVADSKDLIDPDLHEIGVIQSEIHQSIVEQINVKIVFVSPIQRALQTTIHMFKNHPSKDKIKFKVLPIVREILN